MASAAVEPLVDEAVALAHRWAGASADATTARDQRAAHRLATLVADPAGLEHAVRLVDRVARPEDARVVAGQARRLAAGGGLGSIASAAADRAPGAAAAVARRRVHTLVGHLLVDAHEPAVGRHLASTRAAGLRPDVRVLGHASGDRETTDRARRLGTLLARPDVDQVSTTLSSLVGAVSPWDTDAAVARALTGLRALNRSAGGSPAVVTLAAEARRDLDLSLAVLEAVCSDRELAGLELGVTLPACLPESPAALSRVADVAYRRRTAGGADVRVRLVDGADVAAHELLDAELHGRSPAVHGTAQDTDAAYLRLLDDALHPGVAGTVRVVVGSHDLFRLALAHLVAAARGVTGALDIEMAHGVAPAQARAVAAETGRRLVVATPLVTGEDSSATAAYLVRCLEAYARPDGFLRALFGGSLTDAEARLRTSVAARRRVSPQPRDQVRAAGGVDTAEADPALPAVRAAAARALAAPPHEPSGVLLTTPAAVEDVVGRGREAGEKWAEVPADRRAAVLRTVAERLGDGRAALLTQVARETGATIAEAERETASALDLVTRHAAAPFALDEAQHREGLRFTPSPLVLVASSWHDPLAGVVRDVTAALAAGSPVVLAPDRGATGCGELVAEAVHDALRAHGVDSTVLQVVRPADADARRALVAHDHVETVLLTGTRETAHRFSSWRAERPRGTGVLALAGGKNAVVVTPAADLDQAVRDVVDSAFYRAGQSPTAASLLVLVGSVAGSERFRRRLVDAVTSLHVGPPERLGSQLGPLVSPPGGSLLDALTTLQPGESWVVEPRQLDPGGRLWSPGIKEGVWPLSPFHVTACAGPVLGIMTADTLADAVELQNAVGEGMTGGLQSLDEAEVDLWLDRVQVGTAHVNRPTTAGGRRPLVGWKASGAGPGIARGGPHHVGALGSWITEQRPQSAGTPGRRVSALLRTLGVLATDDAEAEWLEVAAASDAAARDHYRAEHEVGGLRTVSTVLRYRPEQRLTVRGGRRTLPVETARMVLAAECAGVPVEVSLHPEVAETARTLAEADPERARQIALAGWRAEDDDAFAARVAAGEVTGAVRVIGTPGAPLVRAAAADPSRVTLWTGEVLASGERELRTVLREQVVSRARHRFGHVPIA